MRTPLFNRPIATTQTAIASTSATDPAVTELFVGTSLSLFGFLVLIILLA
jgi:hypothetical protein